MYIYISQDLLGAFYFRNSTVVHYLVRQKSFDKIKILFGHYYFGSAMIFRTNYELDDLFGMKPIEKIPNVYENYETL